MKVTLSFTTGETEWGNQLGDISDTLRQVMRDIEDSTDHPTMQPIPVRNCIRTPVGSMTFTD